MVDIERDVFDAVYPAVSELVPAGNFKSMYVPNPASLPFATLIEVSSSTNARHLDTSENEPLATINYEANVYAEDKHTCRTVMNALDKAMKNLNFINTMMQFIPNLADDTVFRMTARYVADASENKTIYRHR